MTNADYDHAKWMAQAHLNGLPPADFDDWLKDNLLGLVEQAAKVRPLEDSHDELRAEYDEALDKIRQVKQEVGLIPGARAEACRDVLGMKTRLTPHEVGEALNTLPSRVQEWLSSGKLRLDADGKVRRDDLIEYVESLERPKVRKPLTTGEAVKILQVAPRTVSKWCDSGRLPCEREAGTKNRLIDSEDLRRFMAENGVRIPENFPQ